MAAASEQEPCDDEQSSLDALAQAVLLHPFAVQRLMARCVQWRPGPIRSTEAFMAEGPSLYEATILCSHPTLPAAQAQERPEELRADTPQASLLPGGFVSV